MSDYSDYLEHEKENQDLMDLIDTAMNIEHQAQLKGMSTEEYLNSVTIIEQMALISPLLEETIKKLEEIKKKEENK